MSEPAAAETVTPPVDLSPAVPAAPVTIPDPDTVLARIKERLHAANPPPEAKRPDAEPTPEGETPKLNADPKVMKTLGKLQADKRDLEAKVKALEPLQADAEFGKAVRELWSKTPEEKLQALAKLSGRDGTDELAALVQFFYEREQEKPPEEAGKIAPTPETRALLDALAEVKKELAEIKSGRTTEEETRQKSAAEEDRKNAAAFVERFLTANKERFEISARKENVSEATELIQAAAFEICKRDKIDVKTLTEEAATDLYHRAAAEVEKEYEETGKRFAKVRTGVSIFNPDKYARPLSRPTVTLKREAPSTDPKVRETQLRDRLQRKLENGEFGR